jgi:hypothetical protein
MPFGKKKGNRGFEEKIFLEAPRIALLGAKPNFVWVSKKFFF